MENLISIFNNNLSNISCYFMTEILCIFAIIVNFILYLFCKKYKKINRLSNIITSLTLFFNSIFLTFEIILDKTVILDKFFMVINYESNLSKLFLDIFALFFVCIIAKNTRKLRFKIPFLNSILLSFAVIAGLLFESENLILTYILLELSVILIYKYASNMRTDKTLSYSPDFVATSVLATLLFVIFYIMSYFASNLIQKTILFSCLTLCLLLKIGVFPLYNYLVNKKYKINIPYSILLLCFLPFIGICAFNKITYLIPFKTFDEGYQLTMIVFLLFSVLSFAYSAYNSKNLIKYIANVMYFFASIVLLDCMFNQFSKTDIIFFASIVFCILAIYSLICILKENLKIKKIFITSLKGVFLKNRFYAFIFSAFLLFMTGIIPSAVLLSGLKVLSGIYTYDIIGFSAVCIIVLGLILILINALNIIENLYFFDNKTNVKLYSSKKFYKKTALNYAVCFVVFMFLIINLFL